MSVLRIFADNPAMNEVPLMEAAWRGPGLVTRSEGGPVPAVRIGPLLAPLYAWSALRHDLNLVDVARRAVTKGSPRDTEMLIEMGGGLRSILARLTTPGTMGMLEHAQTRWARIAPESQQIAKSFAYLVGAAGQGDPAAITVLDLMRELNPDRSMNLYASLPPGTALSTDLELVPPRHGNPPLLLTHFAAISEAGRITVVLTRVPLTDDEAMAGLIRTGQEGLAGESQFHVEHAGALLLDGLRLAHAV